MTDSTSIYPAGQAEKLFSPTFHFNSDSLPPEQRFDRYASLYSGIGSVSARSEKQLMGDFRAETKLYSVGATPITFDRSGGFHLLRSRHEIHRSSLDHWVLTVRVHGQSRVEIDGSVVDMPSGSIELRTLDQPFQARVTKNESIHLVLPRSQFVGMESRLDAISRIDGYRTIHPLLGSYLVMLGTKLDSMTQDEALGAGDALLAMVRACASTSRDDLAAAQGPILATQLEMAKLFIDRHLRSPGLDPERVQAMLCVSRRQMYKIFAAEGGVARYIRTRRLRACYRSILQAGEGNSISAIARDFGFSDYASFNRQFRAEYHCRPSELREAVGLDLQGAQVSDWLHGHRAPHALVAPQPAW